jgi:hypothetical protein
MAEVAHQQISADKAKKDVADRVKCAIAELRVEIAAKREAGEEIKALSRNQILRRAGIDKKTLSQPYHKDSKVEVDQFVDSTKKAELGKVRPASLSAQLNNFAQLLFAAQEKLRSQQRVIDDLESKLRSHNNVVTINPKESK